MSYKKKKLKKSKWNRLKYYLRRAMPVGRQVRLALLKRTRELLQKRRKKMRLPQVVATMDFLRRKARTIRRSNKKIDAWVDDYINQCVLQGRPVQLLTQWCISKDLESRLERQGGRFLPTREEVDLFQKGIPDIISKFQEVNIRFEWWITFNRSYLESGRIDLDIERQYKEVIASLASGLPVTVCDWEEDLLEGRPEPDKEVMNQVEKFIEPGAFRIEKERHQTWVKEATDLDQSDADLDRDIRFQIACEAQEPLDLARILGEFIIAPLESQERYDFFVLRDSDFKRRIVAILPTYPWRLKDPE